MGVRRFHSAADMPGPPVRPPLDPNLKIVFGLMGFTHALARLRHAPGVRRFRSWDDALQWRMERDKLEATSTKDAG